MKFECRLKKWKTNKSSARLSILIDPKNVPYKLYNFEDKPLIINLADMARAKGEIKNIEQQVKGPIKLIIMTDQDSKKDIIGYGPELKKKDSFTIKLQVNENEQIKRLNRINGSQRRKAYATMQDIGESLGYELEEIKKALKIKFINSTAYDEISLSDCSKAAASDFINFIIRLGYEMGVQWEEHPRKRMDSLEKWLRLCLDQKICAVSAKPGKRYVIDNSGEIIHEHHTDSIGMGRDRQKIDDSKLKKISLSAKYHNEAHDIGWESFKKKYHVEGIIYP